ncbi:MAG: glycyl-radical enzyme activating protein [Clostridia bacterium]|nr:glycyl-radical enzyme activating protein [Clostridia bacterium]
MRGTVFNIQRFSLYDGPGVRTVVFLKGCPLRCIWCHNPEGLEREPQLMYDSSKCIGCGDCVPECPGHCHEIADGLHFFSRSKCVGCGKCAAVCPTEALSLAGKKLSVEEIIQEVMRDASLYRRRNGGLTLSGGEPLYQSEFAISLLEAAKKNGISTCVETCGAVTPDVLRKAGEVTDIFLYDYKATGEEDHIRLCGASQKIILDNLSLLDKLGAHVILRCPIIPGMNENAHHINGIAETAAAHTSVKEIHLEPFHKLGRSKAEKLGMIDAFDAEVPDKNAMSEYCRIISAISKKHCKIS